MWLMDDLPWSCPNHILVPTVCTCHARLVHCLHVISPDTSANVHHITSCMSFPDISFPTCGRQALACWCFCGSYCPWFGGSSHFLWHYLSKNVSNHPDIFLICSCLYSSGVMLWVSHDGSANLHHPYCIGTSLVVAIVWFNYYTMHPWPLSSHWTTTVDPAIKTEGPFWVSFPLS